MEGQFSLVVQLLEVGSHRDGRRRIETVVHLAVDRLHHLPNRPRTGTDSFENLCFPGNSVVQLPGDGFCRIADLVTVSR